MNALTSTTKGWAHLQYFLTRKQSKMESSNPNILIFIWAASTVLFQVEVDPSWSFSEMRESLLKWRVNWALNRLLEKVDRNEFISSSSTVNAFYSPGKNLIGKKVIGRILSNLILQLSPLEFCNLHSSTRMHQRPSITGILYSLTLIFKRTITEVKATYVL